MYEESPKATARGQDGGRDLPTGKLKTIRQQTDRLNRHVTGAARKTAWPNATEVTEGDVSRYLY